MPMDRHHESFATAEAYSEGRSSCGTVRLMVYRPLMEGDLMLEHKIGTRDKWQTDRDELAKLEAEHAELPRR